MFSLSETWFEGTGSRFGRIGGDKKRGFVFCRSNYRRVT